MRFIAALLLLAAGTGCTTLANRRDLYSPAPSPELERPLVVTTRTTTTRDERDEISYPAVNR
jgi:hypothetical protein